MDYKEKYEQALEVAKETYDKQPMYREWLKKIFPELAESEDEKVRKEIISYLKNRKVYTEAIKDHWIAWLENIPYTIDHEKREGFYLGYKACHEKQCEQKPTDKEMKTLLRTEYEKGRADAIAEMQMEWSEEDEKMINHIISIIEDADDNLIRAENISIYTNWFKSLKDRVKPKQKWSEEDESRIDNLCYFLEKYGNQYYGHLTLQGTISWLKSLRPQSRWKPSDEQMELLSEVQNALLGKDCHNRFTDFIWELKKLKEE